MTNNADQQYQKMTKTPIPRLILALGIPTTISMLISNIYNMADTYFVSCISLSASGATGIVFSLMAILQAFGFMFGHGAGTHISILLGLKDEENASKLASTSFFLAMAVGLLIGILGISFLTPFMYLLGSTDSILASAREYAFFILLAGPAMTCSCVLNNILRYEGKATYAMFGLTGGGILNMLMDPILMFGLDLGVVGAGLSTTISQYISLAILLYPFIRRRTVSRISLGSFSKDYKDSLKIMYTGSPSFLRQSLGSISTACLNLSAKPFGDAAIAAMSIVGRCSNLIFSTSLGIAQGYQPVAGFNYGSRHYSRVKQGAIFTICFDTFLIAIIGVFCYFLAPDIIALFREEAEVIMIGSESLRYLCMFIIFLPFVFVGNIMFQSTGHAIQSLILVFVQCGLFMIPLVLILPHYIGVKGIELAQPLSYLLSAIVTAPFIYTFLKELGELNEIPEESDN